MFLAKQESTVLCGSFAISLDHCGINTHNNQFSCLRTLLNDSEVPKVGLLTKEIRSSFACYFWAVCNYHHV